MKIPSAILQFLTAERQKDMTNLNGSLLDGLLRRRQKRQQNYFLDSDL